MQKTQVQTQAQNKKTLYVVKINIKCENVTSYTNVAVIVLSNRVPSKFDIETLTRLYVKTLRLRLIRGMKYVTALVQKLDNINVTIDKPFEPILYFNHAVPLHLNEVMLSIANGIKVNVVSQQLFQQLQQLNTTRRNRRLAVLLGDPLESTVKSVAEDLSGSVRKVDGVYVIETDKSTEDIFCRLMRVLNDTMRFATIDYVLRRINLHVLADAEPVTVYSFELRYR